MLNRSPRFLTQPITHRIATGRPAAANNVQTKAIRPVYDGTVGWVIKAASIVASLTMVAGPVGAQGVVVPGGRPVILQSSDMAIASDAAAIADRLAIPVVEAARQLRLQQASIAATDALAASLASRLAGIAVEHAPVFRIVVLLTGDAPVPAQVLDIGGGAVPVAFVTGARASHVELVQAITAYQTAIRASLLSPPGLGIDQRTGEMVAVVAARDVAREGAEPLRARLAALTRVPVRLRVVDEPGLDIGGQGVTTGQGVAIGQGVTTGEGVLGGMRMMGGVPGDPRQYLCTAGFVVTDGLRTGLATAAHCPDTLRVRDAAGRQDVLPFEGQWGWGYQDVQINVSAAALAPSFFADTAKTTTRIVTGAQARSGTRAGDIVCHRGERTGYSCSAVELTDFAPAGDLCGGACLPTWTTVAGPACKGGDSGAPVFLGNTAYGLVKGGSYRADGSCAFYFYMSTDYLPPAWTLLTGVEGIVPAPM
jgi:hypothetical protein